MFRSTRQSSVLSTRIFFASPDFPDDWRLKTDDCYCPSLAHVATSDSRCGNSLRSLRRISRAELALHKRSRTDVRRGPRLRRQRSPLGWRVRTQPIARSSLRRSPGTWGCARSGRNRLPPIAAAERPERVFRVPSTRSPKCSAEQQRIPALTEAQQAIAIVLCPSFPRGNRAIAAAARTTKRRTRRRLPAATAQRFGKLNWPSQRPT